MVKLLYWPTGINLGATCFGADAPPTPPTYSRINTILCHLHLPGPAGLRFILGGKSIMLEMISSTSHVPRTHQTNHVLNLRLPPGTNKRRQMRFLSSSPACQHVSRPCASLFVCWGRRVCPSKNQCLKPEKLQFKSTAQPQVLDRA